MQKEKPQLSIVIPCYKVEKYLNKCILSVVNQTYKNLEIILVNDGSPDDVPAICDNWALKDKRIKVIHKQNGGLSDARNTGLSISNGEYIMFIDSDDWINIRMAEIMMNAIISTQSDIICCSTFFEFENRTIKFKSDTKKTILDSKEGIIELLDRRISVSAWGKIYRKSVLENINYPIGCLHEDIPVIFKLFIASTKIINLKDAFYHYRQQAGSISRSQYTPRNMDLYRFINEISYVYKKYPDIKKNYEGFYYFYLRALLVLFADNKTKLVYKEDYILFTSEIKKNYFKIIKNPHISIKDKITIPLILSPLYQKAKQIYSKII